MSRSLSSLNSVQVVEAARNSISVETHATTDVIRHLREIQERKIYLEFGYPSLFEMCTKEFGYSNGAAQRRILAMRLVKDIPEVEEKIAAGEISLSTAASLQSFFQLEKKREVVPSKAERYELVQTCESMSSREVERELARRNPELDRRESIRAVSDDRMRLSYSVTETLWRKMEQLKALRSHVNAKMTNEDLLEWLVELGLDKADPVRKAERAEVRRQKRKSTDSLPASEVKPRHESVLGAEPNRYITADVDHELAKSRSMGCDFVDSATGKRCGSQHFLQRDHIVEYAQGGSNTLENLRWLCGQHNRRRSGVKEPVFHYQVQLVRPRDRSRRWASPESQHAPVSRGAAPSVSERSYPSTSRCPRSATT